QELAAPGRGRRAPSHGRAVERHRLGQAARPRPLGLPEACLDGTAGPPTRNWSERSAAGLVGPFSGRSEGRPRLILPPATQPDTTAEALSPPDDTPGGDRGLPPRHATTGCCPVRAMHRPGPA